MEGFVSKMMVCAIVHAASLVLVVRYSMCRNVLSAVPILLRSVKIVLVAMEMVTVAA